MSFIDEIDEKIKIRKNKIKELEDELKRLKEESNTVLVRSLLEEGRLTGSIWEYNKSERYESNIKKSDDGASTIAELEPLFEKAGYNYKENISDTLTIEVAHSSFRPRSITIYFLWKNINDVAAFVKKHRIIVDLSDEAKAFNNARTRLQELEAVFKL